MAANRRAGWHSGVMHCLDAKILRDLYVQDDIIFSDVSAGTLGVTGGIDMTGTTSAIGITMTGGTFSTSAIQIGSSASKMSISSGQIPLDINTTTSDTSGMQTSVNVKQTQTANTRANQTEVLVAELETNYETGDWANALVGRIDYSSTGDAAGGMVAPICSELNYPGKACAGIGGAYYVLDLEMNCPENFTCGTNLSYPNGWINFGIWGNATAIASWEDYGFLFRTDGFTGASGNIFSANAQTARVRVEDSAGDPATRYLVLSQSEDSITLAGALTDAIKITGACTDGVEISGACANGINISGACTTAAINITTANLNGIKSVYNIGAQLGQYVQGIKIEHTRNADIQPSTGGWWGMQVVLNAGTGYTALDQPAYVIHGVFKGDATDPSTDCINVARFETQSNGKVEDLLFVSANSGSTVEGDIARFVAHVAPTRSILALQNGTVGSTPVALYIDADETMTTAIKVDNGAVITNMFEVASDARAPYSATDISGNTEQGHLVVKIGANTYGIPLYSTS